MIAVALAFAWIGQTTEVHVRAAASLRESFQAIAKAYEAKNPGLKIVLEFAGSQELAAQINQGAPTDIFASAAPKNLEQIAYDPTSRRIFALNRLVVVTPTRHKLSDFRGLDHTKRLVLAAPAVPAGGYARLALNQAGLAYRGGWTKRVLSHVVSEEQDVRAVLSKVQLGEADAGIVYASDAVAAKGKVATTAIPAEYQPEIQYVLGIPKAASQAHEAMHFIHAILAPGGQEALQGQGFVSILGHATKLRVHFGRLNMVHKLPLSGITKTVTATNPGGKPQSYTGMPFEKLVPSTYGDIVKCIGADGYEQIFSYAKLRAAGAVIVPFQEKYAQIVIPGEKPRAWVSWLTDIVVPGSLQK